MAGRIRTIKPELLEDEKAAALTHLEWRLFVSLLLVADDYGNFRASGRYLLGAALWGTDATLEDTEAALDRLASLTLIARYTVRGQAYGHVTHWDRHQRVDRPGAPRVPGPDMEETPIEPTMCDHHANATRMPREPHATDPDPDPDPDQEQEQERAGAGPEPLVEADPRTAAILAALAASSSSSVIMRPERFAETLLGAIGPLALQLEPRECARAIREALAVAEDGIMEGPLKRLCLGYLRQAAKRPPGEIEHARRSGRLGHETATAREIKPSTVWDTFGEDKKR